MPGVRHCIMPFALDSMLRRLKLLALGMAHHSGANSLLLNSRWRRRRLLILCYHGTSLADEHEWDPSLYITPDLLRGRFQMLADQRCSVLPLEEAVERLYRGDLPERAVALTFDDGAYDFYKAAHPIVREFGFPVTVYLTTYYSRFNRPVFDVMCSYLLWKARGERLEWPEVLAGERLLDGAGCQAAGRELKKHASERRLSGREKDELLAALAARLHIDYEGLCRERILHLMTPAEARELAIAGVDVQLHTHRHRVSQRRDLFEREIEENRRWIAEITSRPARHFCYPGGFHLPEFLPWLRDLDVKSATTCEPGLGARKTDPLLLPRLVDTTHLTGVEFRSWLSGAASFLPKRPHLMSEGQLLEDFYDPLTARED